MEYEITKDNFDELIENNSGISLVDFWAVWCAPCQMQAPIIEELATEMKDITVGKVNVDEQMELSMKFGITAIPTIMLFKNGECVKQTQGYQTKEQLINMIESYR